MARVERFEDLTAWQKARTFTRVIYQVTRHGGFARDYALTSQIQRAAVSVMSNVAEGFDRGNRAEFHQYLSIAKGSCAETRSLLYVAFDAQYLDEANFQRLLADAEEVIRLVAALRSAVERQRDEQRAANRSST
jgi:four helix bundle protein